MSDEHCGVGQFDDAVAHSAAKPGHGGKPWPLGKPLPPETRAKISRAKRNPGLSYTQGRILQALADGIGLEHIAEKLRINASYESVRSQAHLIRIKLGATTTAHAVAIGFRNGLVK